MVFGTVGNGDYGYVIGMEFVAGREPGCWVGKGPELLCVQKPWVQK